MVLQYYVSLVMMTGSNSAAFRTCIRTEVTVRNSAKRLSDKHIKTTDKKEDNVMDNR